MDAVSLPKMTGHCRATQNGVFTVEDQESLAVFQQTVVDEAHLQISLRRDVDGIDDMASVKLVGESAVDNNVVVELITVMAQDNLLHLIFVDPRQ